MTTPPPSETGPSAEAVIAAFTAKGFRLKIVVNIDSPGMEGHPIAIHHLLEAISAALRDRERSALLEAARAGCSGCHANEPETRLGWPGWWHHIEGNLWSTCARPEVWDALSLPPAKDPAILARNLPPGGQK